jgi:hypothetical protein
VITPPTAGVPDALGLGTTLGASVAATDTAGVCRDERGVALDVGGAGDVAEGTVVDGEVCAEPPQPPSTINPPTTIPIGPDSGRVTGLAPKRACRDWAGSVLVTSP